MHAIDASKAGIPVSVAMPRRARSRVSLRPWKYISAINGGAMAVTITMDIDTILTDRKAGIPVSVAMPRRARSRVSLRPWKYISAINGGAMAVTITMDIDTILTNRFAAP